MNSGFHVIIPARYHSTRLPGKLMKELAGKTVIERVYRQVQQARPESIIIATDHEQIADHARSFGAEVIMTSPEHETGTDRIAEVVRHCAFDARDIIVNVQGDEPFIAPELIAQVANSLSGSQVSMATLCWPVAHYEELVNSDVVKVVRDKANNALYFSRSAIPANRDQPGALQHVFRHIGLYAYRVAFLLEYVNWPVCPLEQCESLEQLRVLWAGHKIRVEQACVLPAQDINSEADLFKARQALDILQVQD